MIFHRPIQSISLEFHPVQPTISDRVNVQCLQWHRQLSSIHQPAKSVWLPEQLAAPESQLQLFMYCQNNGIWFRLFPTFISFSNSFLPFFTDNHSHFVVRRISQRSHWQLSNSSSTYPDELDLRSGIPCGMDIIWKIALSSFLILFYLQKAACWKSEKEGT